MKKFDAISGLKTILCLGIVLLHIKENTNYQIGGYFYNNVIPFFTQFVFLFMILSSFGMCCGYYEKIKNGKITPNEFYKKRLMKILPFFFVVVLLEVIYEHSIVSVVEGFADLSLSFALVSNYEISVIGVGWFIGVVFLFYMIFPYFVFLMDNKKRAWLTLIISLLLNFACIGLFDVGRTNFLFDFIYFVLGGIIYLYRDEIIKFTSISKLLNLALIVISTILYFLIPENAYISTIKIFMLFAIWIICTLTLEGKILNNRFTRFISSLSMEIYLSHMIIFRVIEKLNLLKITNLDILNYCIVSIITIVAVIIFDLIIKNVIEFLKNKFEKVFIN